MRVVVVAGVVLALAGLAGAGTAVGAAPQAESARLFDVTAARGIAEGRPVGAADVFPPDAGPIVIWFRFAGLPPGARLQATWHYLEMEAPYEIGAAEAVARPGADWADFSLELAPGRPWPEGGYRVDLSVNGRVLHAVRFRVAVTDPPAGAGRHQDPAFTMDLPAGWAAAKPPDPASARFLSPAGDAFIEVTDGAVSHLLDPVSYAAGWESVSVGAGARLQSKLSGRVVQIDGTPAYEGTYDGGEVLVRVVFVARPDRFFVITGVFAREAFPAGVGLFERAVGSFRTAAGR
ncbi:MAG: hypothetical protein Q8L86_14475 [Vicinamibacterales bacterium]|nr:hypothetical protein [Vicinamibacterales bacterium]